MLTKVLNLVKRVSLQHHGLLGMNCRNISYIGKHNNRRLFPLVDDKLKTKLLATQHDISTPKLQMVIRHLYQLKNLEEKLTQCQRFAIKPAKGSGGRGILIITECTKGFFIKSSGARLSFADLKRHLTNILAGIYSLSGTPDVAIVEDLIDMANIFDGFSYQGIPDIRVVVFKGYPVMAMLRLSTHASDGKANLHQGAIGVGLDITTGQCLNAIQHTSTVTRHPDTGNPLSEIYIPDWREILILASRCFEMTGLGYIGTDVVIDRNLGPLVLELNARPGLSIQLANGCGLLPRLHHIESISIPHHSAEERVRHAMSVFGRCPSTNHTSPPIEWTTFQPAT